MKIREIAKIVFKVTAGTYIGYYLAECLVIAPIKALDKVAAKKLDSWADKEIKKLNEKLEKTEKMMKEQNERLKSFEDSLKKDGGYDE